MKRYEMFWNDQEARERTEGKWVRYDDARAVIDGLQALLNERDEKWAKSTVGPVEFNTEVVLPAPSDPRWATPVTAMFDGAEGEGRLWLSVGPEHDDDEPSIAIEGRENARTLAHLLLAWAGDK